MKYFKNDSNGLIYTADEARRFTLEQMDDDTLDEAMARRYTFSELFPYLPEDEQERVLQDAIDEKMSWLFSDCDPEADDLIDLIFAHDCPGHAV